MKSTLIVGLVGMLALGSCGVLDPNNGPLVTGTLNANSAGAKFGSNTRLALIPVGLDGVFGTKYYGQRAVVDAEFTGGFNFSLPQTADTGSYKLVAYVDANGNGTLDSGETRATNADKYVVYSNGSTTFDGKTFAQGWSYYDRSTGGVTQTGPFQGYAITYPN